MGLPSTLDEGTRKSQPLPEGTTTDPKDSWGNIQPADKGLPSTAFNKGTIKTTLHLEGSLRDKDLGETNHLLIWNQSTLLLLILQGLVLSTRESGRDDMEEETQANEEEYQSPSPNKDKPEPYYSPTTQDSDSNSSSPDLKKFNNTLPLTKRQLIKYLRKTKEILEELEIQSALPALVPKQALSESSGRKRKHIELEPEIKVPGLECNRSLLIGVLFVNNMVIEEPKYGIFFTNVFADQAFQR
nr:copia protein [Tanacetum cinerariifolium]